MSMASIDQSKLIVNKNDEKINKNSTKVVIIASVNDDDEKILSYLNTTDAETILLNLEDSNLIGGISNKKNLTNSIPLKDESSINQRNHSKTRKRKADLTCVVCGGEAMGYNFSQITCESCKAFFRRNALHPIEKTKCLKNNRNNTEIFCEIKSTLKHKCQRCRLLKCFQNGMRKDYILTHEERLIKKQRLEENRQLRHSPIIRTETTKYSSNDKSIKLTNIPSPISSTLTPEDWTCLKHIQNSYLSASQSSPSASSVVSLELAPDKMSAFMYTFDIQNFAAVKLINFLREIPEFEQLNEHDRLLLVKYNLTLLFLIRHSLTYDSGKEICYDHDTPSTISPTDEAFAQHCKSLFILCYGYEFHRAVILLLDNLSNLTNRDPLITELIMLIVIFSKGLSADGDQEPILEDSQLVLQAQSKYTDLLIRYLMNNSTYESVPMKMVRLVQQILRIQRISRDFQQYVKTKVDVTYINPLMKSLLHLT